jgi:hypothetical protein
MSIADIFFDEIVETAIIKVDVKKKENYWLIEHIFFD